MILKFINRENELEFLENQYKQKSKSFVVIYGRRRVGKTELIKKFIFNKPHIYFLVSQEPSHIQLQRLIKKFAEYLNEQVPRIDDWVEAIDYFGEKMKQKKILLVIDEFPYLIDSNKSISSYFQRLNDEFLNQSSSMLILSGSSISMMESEVLGSKSPLHGRRTGQIDLSTFNFKKTGLIIKKGIGERIVAYAIFGNTPMYLSFFDNGKTINENIFMNILYKNSFLYKEPEFILKQELREPSNYMSILTAIASGSTRTNVISGKTKISPGTLSKYLDQLIKLRLIKREIPVTERNKKSKKSLYFISDSLFSFWFRFVEPNISDVEDNPKRFLEQTIIPSLPEYVSKKFEDVCEEFIKESEDYGKIGRQWGKIPKAEKGKNTYEIDIVALNEKTKDILFCECKWQNKVNAEKVLKELKEKSKYVDWNNEKRKEHFAIFAKSFKDKKKIKGVKLFDLKSIGKVFKY